MIPDPQEAKWARPSSPTFLRLPDVLARRGRSRSSLFRDIGAGLFPPGIALGARCTGWVQDEVDFVLRAQVAGASADELRALVVRLIASRRSRMERLESSGSFLMPPELDGPVKETRS